jgi:hypothetical protein
MPNTLAHVGFQGLITRSLLRDSDFKWIYIGCVLPDLPWIVQRLVRFTASGVDPYALRLYGIVQASFLFCLILGLAIAVLTRHSTRTFQILSINAFLHLLLDASQSKWATGVHLLAPLRWKQTNFGFFWPESPLTYILTTLGLGLILVTWKKSYRTPIGFLPPSHPRIVLSIMLGILYIFLPFSLLDGPAEADNHFVKTLREYEKRPGRYLGIDRKDYFRNEEGGFIRTFAGESLAVEGVEVDRAAVLSIRGRFLSVDRVEVEEYHVHSRFRNMASYVGLSMIAILWISALVRKALK